MKKKYIKKVLIGFLTWHMTESMELNNINESLLNDKKKIINKSREIINELNNIIFFLENLKNEFLEKYESRFKRIEKLPISNTINELIIFNNNEEIKKRDLKNQILRFRKKNPQDKLGEIEIFQEFYKKAVDNKQKALDNKQEEKAFHILYKAIEDYKNNYKTYICNEIVNNEFDISLCNKEINTIKPNNNITQLVKNYFYISYYLIHNSYYMENNMVDNKELNEDYNNTTEKYSSFLKKSQVFYIPILKAKFVEHIKIILKKQENKEDLTKNEQRNLTQYEIEAKNFNEFYEKRLVDMHDSYKKIKDLIKVHNYCLHVIKNFNNMNKENLPFFSKIESNIWLNFTCRDKDDENINFIFYNLSKSIIYLKTYSFEDFSSMFMKIYDEYMSILYKDKKYMENFNFYDFNLNLLSTLFSNINNCLGIIQFKIKEEIIQFLKEKEKLEKKLKTNITELNQSLAIYEKAHIKTCIQYGDYAKNHFIPQDKKDHFQFNGKSIYDGY